MNAWENVAENIKDRGFPLVMYAAYQKSPDKVKFLVEHGLKPKSINAPTFKTVLSTLWNLPAIRLLEQWLDVLEVDAGVDYRLRTLEAGPECDIDYAGGGFPEMIVGEGSVAAGSPVFRSV